MQLLRTRPTESAGRERCRSPVPAMALCRPFLSGTGISKQCMGTSWRASVSFGRGGGNHQLLRYGRDHDCPRSRHRRWLPSASILLLGEVEPTTESTQELPQRYRGRHLLRQAGAHALVGRRPANELLDRTAHSIIVRPPPPSVSKAGGTNAAPDSIGGSTARLRSGYVRWIGLNRNRCQDRATKRRAGRARCRSCADGSRPDRWS